MLISGTLGTLTLKQLSRPVYNGQAFDHPYFFTGLNFLSECCCLVIHKILFLAQTTQNEEISIKGKLLFSIPALFEAFSSVLMLIGLSLSTASIYQMMRGFIVIVTYTYSIIFFKAGIFKHQLFGLSQILLGLLIIGISSLTSSSESSKNPGLGIALIVLSQFFSGGKYIIEQYLFKIYQIHPLKAVGLEGVSGLGLSIIILPILNTIPCTRSNICNNDYVENSLSALSQIFNNFFLFAVIVCAMSIIIIFSFSGISVTKIAGAVARTTIDITRMVFVWLASILMGWERFNWVQMIGFIILVFGTLVYNEIIVVKFFKDRDIGYLSKADEEKQIIGNEEKLYFELQENS